MSRTLDQVTGKRGHGLRICAANLDKIPQERVRLMLETPADRQNNFKSPSEAVHYHNGSGKGYGPAIDAMELLTRSAGADGPRPRRPSAREM